MKNFEKFEEKVKQIVYSNKPIAVVNNKPCVCEGECTGCKFDKNKGDMRGCIPKAFEWLYEEYKESNKKHKKETIKISRLDYELLKFLQKQGAKWISRDKKGSLNVSENKPKRDYGTWMADGEFEYCTGYFKGLLSFVESYFIAPVPIQNVLDNCEMVDNE